MSASVDGPPGAAPPSPPGFPPETFRANLYVHHADGRVEWYALLPASFARGPLVLGREPDCAINIDDGATSGHHARIEARGPALWLTDLGSTNGTLFEESRLRPGRPIRLADGAVIGVGNADIRFLYSRRTSLLRLVAEFTDGPLAGSRRVTEGPSTTIGRGAELDLDGPGVANRHLRIDAYDAEHIYVVPLDPEARTRVFGAELAGITPISSGAELSIGPHRFRLRVERAPEAIDRAAPDAPPPRVDAAMLEARLQGRDPRKFDRRTIMDLSPLGAMVAKVLAGEVPPPPSAVRPPVRRPTNVSTTVSRGPLELNRRTGPLPAARSGASSTWVRAVAVALILVAVIAVAGLIPVARPVVVVGALVAGPTVDVRASVRGRLLSRSAALTVGDPVRAGAPLARVADGAIEREIDRLSHEIGALEVYIGQGRVDRVAVRRAEADVEVAEAVVQQRVDAAAASGDGTGLMEARRTLAERRGRLEALRARRADRDAGAEDAAEALGRAVRRREALARRLVIVLEAPVDGRIEQVPSAPVGAEVDGGHVLYRLTPLDPLITRLEGPDVAVAAEHAGRRALASLLGGSFEVELALEPDGSYLVRVPAPEGRPAPGTPIELLIQGPPGTALGWIGERLGLR